MKLRLIFLIVALSLIVGQAYGETIQADLEADAAKLKVDIDLLSNELLLHKHEARRAELPAPRPPADSKVESSGTSD